MTPAERFPITFCSDEMISVGGTPAVLLKRSVRASAATDCKRKRNSAYDKHTASTGDSTYQMKEVPTVYLEYAHLYMHLPL